METKNSITKSPIAFSDSAIEEIKQLQQQETKTKHLRIGAKSGGCSGLTYILEFDNITENDVTYQYKDVHFIVDSSHLIYLKNLSVEFDNGLNARGFTFHNPNASETCGCGTSFSV